jgi:hypothetical protein
MLFVFQTFFTEKMVKISKLFTPFQLSFEFFTSNQKSGENVLGFPPSFQLKNQWKTNNIFH